MSTDAPPDRLALLTAEEILRTIYGDDLKGCAVSLESIADIISNAVQQKESQTTELLDLYDKVIEAVQLLSTPPDPSKVTDAKQLDAMLSERLDAIRVVTAKTIETVGLFRTRRSSEGGG